MKNINYIFIILLSLIIKIDRINAQNTGCPEPMVNSDSPKCSGLGVEMSATGVAFNGETITGQRWYTSTSKYFTVESQVMVNSGNVYSTRVIAYSPVTYYVVNVCGSTESPTVAVSASFTPSTTPYIGISSSTSVSGVNGTEPYINICNGTSITFQSSASHSGTYQWYRSGLAIPGANSSSYTTSTFSDNDLITVGLSNIPGTCLTSTSIRSEGIRIRVTSPDIPTVSISAPSAACSNDAVTFTANPTHGGNPPTYKWYLDNVYKTSTTERTFSPGALTAGGHTVMVEMQSSQTCVSPISVTASVPITITQTQAFDPLLQGSSEICSSNPAGFYVYSNTSLPGISYFWTKNGSYAGGDNFYSIPAEEVKNGDVVACKVTINNASCVTNNPATLSKTITVTQIIDPTLTILADKSSFCDGDMVTFSAVSNGDLSKHNWSISGGGVSGTGTGNTFTTVFRAGSVVSLTATSSGTGCFRSGTVSADTRSLALVIKSLPTATISANRTTVNCSYPSSTLTASGGNSYLWSTASNSNAITVSPSANTSYTVTVTGSNGCKSSISQSITFDKTPPTALISATRTTVSCTNSSTTLTASGGTGYLWSTASNSNAITVSPSANTSYTVTVTGANGCTSSISQSITTDKTPPTASISATRTTVSCTNPSTTLTASGGNIYLWSTASNSNAITVSPSANTSYTVTVTGANGCASSISQSITTDKALPPASISVDAGRTTVDCNNPSATLTASGGTSYLWSTTSPSNIITVSPSVNTTYSVTVTGANGCLSVASQLISASKTPPSNPGSISVQYNCSSAQLTPPTPPSQTVFYWQTSSTGTSTSTTGNYLVGGAGTYYLRAKNSQGCWSTGSSSVTVNAFIPVATPQISVQSCIGSGNVIFSVTNTSSFSSCKWYDSGNILKGTSFSQSVASNAGSQVNYSVTLTNSSNCSVTQPVTGYAYNVPEVSSSNNSISTGDNVQLTVNKAYGSIVFSPIKWFKEDVAIEGANTEALTVNQPGIYTVQVGMAGVTSTVTSSPKAIVNRREAQPNMNYIISRTIFQDNIKSESAIAALPIGSIQESVVYYDGLGRPVQNVIWQGSPSMKDIVQPIAYDKIGRENKKYLPYTDGSNGLFKANALEDPASTSNDQTTRYKSGQQYKYYQGIAPVTDTYPYSEASYDNSPLNRVTAQREPGADWRSYGTSIGYGTNKTGSSIRKFEITSTGFKMNGFYADNSLFATDTWQPNSSTSFNQVREFKDLKGQVVAKAIMSGSGMPSTYYVYDDFGRLAYVYPPAASSIYSFSEKDANFQKYIYAYKYDGRGRMIAKHIPGTGWIFMIYDNRDRLVLTQDSTQRLSSKWMFTKYDEMNRPIMTGLVGSAKTRATLMSEISGYFGTFSETPTNTSKIGYSLNKSYSSIFTIAETDVLTVTYYDNYAFKPVTGFTGLDYNATHAYGVIAFDKLKGLVTGSKIKVLDGNEHTSSAQWLSSISYYDNKYRAIQVQRTLYDGATGGKEIASTKYDFSGKVLETKQSQTFNSVENIVAKKMTYDHAGRLKKTEQSINNGAYTTTSEMAYNELGQLADKKLHGGQQSIDYTYNIRGWLTQINNPDNLSADANDTYADLFAMRLNYQKTETGVMTDANQLKRDGNISSMVWNATGKGRQGYAFTYDGMQRLLGSDYKKYNTTTSAWEESLAYEEKGITYDTNGNILTLQRTNATGGVQDNYTYAYNGNQLLSLTNTINGIADIRSYVYDGNGNAIKDGLRGFDVLYNLLNLPKGISKSTDNIAYIYSAAGEKLAKKLKDNTYQYYAGSMVYNSDKALSYALFEEGRVTKQGSSFTYEYHLKDHLGNTRVSFQPGSSGATVLQVAEYYPFGSSFKPMDPNNDNKYLYNGKEKQDDVLSGTALDWYDYEARFYDPQIGRFTTSDPNTEDYTSWTPYCYVGNNPISNIDPDGMDWYSYTSTNENGETSSAYIWREGSDATIDIDGTTYENVGSMLGVELSDGSIVIYNQNEVFGIVDGDQPVGNANELAVLHRLTDPQSEVTSSTMTKEWDMLFFSAEAALMIAGEAGMSGQNTIPKSRASRNNAGPKPRGAQKLELNGSEQQNVNRFMKKAPANSKPPTMRRLGNGNLEVAIESPGKVPGSKAIYVKEIDNAGNTVKMYKVTRDPQGNIVHTKNKMQ